MGIRHIISSIIFVLLVSIMLTGTIGIWILVASLFITALLVMSFNRIIGKCILALAIIPLIVYISSPLLLSVSAQFHTDANTHGTSTSGNTSGNSEKPSPNIANGSPKMPSAPDANSNESQPEITIPDPIAPARPKEDQGTVETTSMEEADTTTIKNTVLSSRTAKNCVVETEANPDPEEIVHFTSGDITVNIIHCELKGNVIRISGNVQYDGAGTHEVRFHPFTVSDSDGTSYPIMRGGNFGSQGDFGLGSCSQFMDMLTPITFSFDAGPINGKAPTSINLSMPNTFTPLGTNVLFIRLKLS